MEGRLEAAEMEQLALKEELRRAEERSGGLRAKSWQGRGRAPIRPGNAGRRSQPGGGGWAAGGGPGRPRSCLRSRGCCCRQRPSARGLDRRGGIPQRTLRCYWTHAQRPGAGNLPRRRRRPRRASAIRNLAYPCTAQTLVAAVPAEGVSRGRFGARWDRAMREPASVLRGIALPRTPVNKAYRA